jgi:hypothetical protein
MCILRTRIMRLRKPTKLGESSESWSRQEVRASECVAKTWRYFVSLLRLLVLAVPLLLAFGSPGFLRWRDDC